MQKPKRLWQLNRRISSGETTWQRASKDTNIFRRESKWWFLGVEVAGTAVFVIVGSLVGFGLIPESATPFQRNAYPAIGAGVGLAFGLLLTYALIFAWNLFRAPYRQRNEARQQYRECRRAMLATKERSLNNSLSLVYDDVFYSVCRERLINNKDEIHRIGISNIGDQTIYNVEVRMHGHSTFQPAPPELPLRLSYIQGGSPHTFDVNPSSDWHLDRCVDFVVWRKRERMIEFCFAGQQEAVSAYKLVKGREYAVTLGISAKDARIDKEWSAILSFGSHGLDINLSEIEVLDLG